MPTDLFHSGAEGTIIEEPESLPRVIWGLESDETSGSRPSAKSAVAHTHSQKSKAPIASEPTRPLPQAKPDPKSATVSNINARPRSNSSTTRQPQIPTHQASATSQRSAPVHQPPQPPDFILKHSEPIDLGRLMAPANDNTHPEYYTSQSIGWQSPFYHGMPTPELVHDLSPELQAMLFAQERLKHNGLSPSTTSGSLSASSSVASLLDSLKSSRSPIVIEDFASQYSSGSSAFPASALHIAQNQKYRQQQFHLPTPPSSTSPTWSTSFSPYQGGLLSPELLAAAGLAQYGSTHVSSHLVPPRLEGTQQGFRRPLGNTSLDVRSTNACRLAPAASINPNVPPQLPPRLAAEYTRRRAVPDTSQSFEPPHSSHDLNGSPTVPKVPPNTPHGAVTSSYGLRRFDAPAAPSGHDAPAHGHPQHMRSIPLSRLAQRRLSTVPEEDYASSADGRTPPAQSRMKAGGSPGATGLHLFLSPSGRVNAASLGLLGDTLGTRYGMDDMGVPGEKARIVVPSVKLAGVPGQVPGPVALSEAPLVKEGSRRQGTSNINNDGGKRGENGRGRGQKRGGRGRRGRTGIHGAERVDGGIVVKS